MTASRFGSVNTRGGQAVNFSYPFELGADRQQVEAEFQRTKDTLAALEDISLPSTHEVNVAHGGYGRYSRYDLVQKEYQGGKTGFYEVLEVRDAPDGRHPYVSNGHISTGDWFSNFFAEWESVDAAVSHAKSTGGYIVSLEMLRTGIGPREKSRTSWDEEIKNREVPGLIRAVDTGYLSPWFYATGDSELMGDFVFPEHLAQDPIFTVGKQFLVSETSDKTRDKIKVLKTCMGCVVRDVPRRNSSYTYRGEVPAQVDKYRAVQWHDGSITPVYPNTKQDDIPVPLADSDTWVVDAQRKFNELLAGRNSSFEVNFNNGGKFVGKYVPPAESPKPTPAGDYFIVVTMEDGSVREGWVNDFVPSDEYPTITLFVEGKMDGNIAQIETKQRKTDGNGKKWPGVYHGSSQAERLTESVDKSSSKT